MADVPDTIVLKRNRDLEGRQHDIWIRRAVFLLIVVVPVLALANVFGQRPGSRTLVSPAASLLVLGSGWLEGMTLNTLEPSPVNEASDNGRLSLELGHIPQGESYLLFAQFQVNPTNVGRRTQTVELKDGETSLLSYERTVTIFP